MIKKILLLLVVSTTLSGCFMAPMALLGPVTSGFSTASLLQSGVTTTASYIVKVNTGKTVSEHVLGTIYKNNEKALQQSYFPKDKFIAQTQFPASKPFK